MVSEIKHFDGEIGILDGGQQKNMIVNSQVFDGFIFEF